MDRRIVKTKKCLKDALRRLLSEKDLSRITVTEICEEASTGRLTFYKYYSDKEDLLKDCFSEAQIQIREECRKMEASAAPVNLEEHLANLIDACMNVAEEYRTAISRLFSNPDSLQMYYTLFMDAADRWEKENGQLIQTAYPLRQLNSFAVMGIWGYIYGRPENTSSDKLRKQLKKLACDLLKAGLIEKRQWPGSGDN